MYAYYNLQMQGLHFKSFLIIPEGNEKYSLTAITIKGPIKALNP